MKEKDETPEYEAKSHPAKFLHKAAKLADKKLGLGKKGKAKKSRKRSAKRY